MGRACSVRPSVVLALAVCTGCAERPLPGGDGASGVAPQRVDASSSRDGLAWTADAWRLASCRDLEHRYRVLMRRAEGCTSGAGSCTVRLQGSTADTCHPAMVSSEHPTEIAEMRAIQRAVEAKHCTHLWCCSLQPAAARCVDGRCAVTAWSNPCAKPYPDGGR